MFACNTAHVCKCIDDKITDDGLLSVHISKSILDVSASFIDVENAFGSDPDDCASTVNESDFEKCTSSEDEVEFSSASSASFIDVWADDFVPGLDPSLLRVSRVSRFSALRPEWKAKTREICNKSDKIVRGTVDVVVSTPQQEEERPVSKPAVPPVLHLIKNSGLPSVNQMLTIDRRQADTVQYGTHCRSGDDSDANVVEKQLSEFVQKCSNVGAMIRKKVALRRDDEKESPTAEMRENVPLKEDQLETSDPVGSGDGSDANVVEKQLSEFVEKCSDVGAMIQEKVALRRDEEKEFPTAEKSDVVPRKEDQHDMRGPVEFEPERIEQVRSLDEELDVTKTNRCEIKKSPTAEMRDAVPLKEDELDMRDPVESEPDRIEQARQSEEELDVTKTNYTNTSYCFLSDSKVDRKGVENCDDNKTMASF